MGDPLLWNTIHFVPGRGCLPRTELFLKRSLATPLDITLPARADNYLPTLPSSASLHPGKRNEEISEFLILIEPASQRWRSLDLVIYDDLGALLRPLWTDNAPILENLRLNRIGASFFARHYVLMPNVSHQLRTLSLSQISLDWDQFHCNRLVDLSLGPFNNLDPGPNLRQMTCILDANSASLRSLAFRGDFQTIPVEEVNYEKICMQKLETLKIYGDWNALILQLFECELPAIRALEMNVAMDRNPPEGLIVRLNRRPLVLEGVTELTLGFTGMSRSRAWSFFSVALPRVETVRLMGHVPLDEKIVLFLNQNWPGVKSFFLSEATLPMVKRLISDRRARSSNEELSIHLKIATAPIYEEDFVWIESNLAQWSVASVRQQAKGVLMLSRTIEMFDRALLLKEGQQLEKRIPNQPRLRQL